MWRRRLSFTCSHIELHRKLDLLLEQQALILTRMETERKQEAVQMAKIEDVQAKVAELRTSVEAETDIVTSVRTLLEGQNAMLASLRQQLSDAIANGSNPAAIDAVLTQMNELLAQNEANKAATVAAVTANTPSQ